MEEDALAAYEQVYHPMPLPRPRPRTLTGRLGRLGRGGR